MEEFFTKGQEQIVSSDRELYTPSPFARASLLHLQETGSLTALLPHVSKRSSLNSYLFFLVVSGAGTQTYNGKEYSLKKGSCVFIDCRRPYSHSPLKEDLWSLKWVHFFGPTMNSIYDKYCERGGRPVFEPRDTSALTDILDSLIKTARSTDYMRDMLINEQLSSLIRLIMSESWHPEDGAKALKKRSVLAVKEYLEEHYAERISLDELSEIFYIDKYYLSKTFRAQFGLNISDHLRNLRINHAKQLLRFTDKTVEEIGYETGVGNPAYFSRIFKAVEGVSPKIYREQW